MSKETAIKRIQEYVIGINDALESCAEIAFAEIALDLCEVSSLTENMRMHINEIINDEIKERSGAK